MITPKENATSYTDIVMALSYEDLSRLQPAEGRTWFLQFDFRTICKFFNKHALQVFD
jgi:hypothetical protein